MLNDLTLGPGFLWQPREHRQRENMPTNQIGKRIHKPDVDAPLKVEVPWFGLSHTSIVMRLPIPGSGTDSSDAIMQDSMRNLLSFKPKGNQAYPVFFGIIDPDFLKDGSWSIFSRLDTREKSANTFSPESSVK